MEIRKLDLSDSKILLQIENATMGEDALTESAAAMVLNFGKVFGVFSDDKPIGAIEILFGKDPQEVFLWGYGVLPEYRSQGVAVALRQAVIEESIKQGRSLLYGEIRTNNFPSIARRLEEKGAFLVDYLPDFYRKGEDWFAALTKLDMDVKNDAERNKELIAARITQGFMPLFVGSKHIHSRQKVFENGDKAISAILRTTMLGLNESEYGLSIFVFGQLPEEIRKTRKARKVIHLDEAERLVSLGNRILSPLRWDMLDFRLIEEFGDLVCVPDMNNPKAMATIIYDSDPDVAHIWHYGAETCGEKGTLLKQLDEKIKEVTAKNGRKYIKPR